MALTMDAGAVEEIVGVLVAVTGDTVQNGMEGLSRLVRENEGNEIMEKFSSECKKMQTCYNDKFVSGTAGMISELLKIPQLSDIVTKAAANMADAKTGSSDFQADSIELPEL